jgi:O-acetyl-ADP-ribose deacetylase (regulator of RNase III)
VAAAHEVRSIAFPSISTGAYGFPIAEAAPVALAAVAAFLQAHPGRLDAVRLVVFDLADLSVYTEALARL